MTLLLYILRVGRLVVRYWFVHRTRPVTTVDAGHDDVVDAPCYLATLPTAAPALPRFPHYAYRLPLINFNRACALYATRYRTACLSAYASAILPRWRLVRFPYLQYHY